MIRAKSTAQNATKLSGIMEYGSESVLRGLKSNRLTVRVEKMFDFQFFLRGGWPFLIIA